MSHLLLLAPAATLLLLAMTGCTLTRGGYETASYQVIRSAGKFEVRDYPLIALVEAPMNGGESNNGFSRLFGYISGSNESGRKIPMTTPVFMRGEGRSGTMSFVMPSDMKLNEVPKPTEKTLSLKELPSGQYAVLRYSSSRSPEHQDAAARALRLWIQAEGLTSESEPIFGYFDPPWTPTFFRRNEVMIRIGKTTQTLP